MCKLHAVTDVFLLQVTQNVLLHQPRTNRGRVYDWLKLRLHIYINSYDKVKLTMIIAFIVLFTIHVSIRSYIFRIQALSVCVVTGMTLHKTKYCYHY